MVYKGVPIGEERRVVDIRYRNGHIDADKSRREQIILRGHLKSVEEKRELKRKES